MSEAATRHAEQLAYWNGPQAEHWVVEQDRLDAMLAPIADVLLTEAVVPAGANVLDIGCGCGATSIALARLVGRSGRVIALDVSGPMLARARERTAALGNVECVLADAATYAFAPHAADLAISRFGVMFFGEPATAFANVRGALKSDGRVLFACWRTLDENAWAEVPFSAALELVPRPPKPGPEDPGPFSFASRDRVTRILTEAGFQVPLFTPLDVPLDLAGGGGLDEAAEQASRIGPASRALTDQPAAIRSAAVAAIRRALAPFANATGVLVPGAAWIVECAAA
jgi:SAM-dependent methyltransferase